jgi:hypothetical protein
MIAIALTLAVAIPISIIWSKLIVNDTTTKEERDNTQFP